MDTALATRTVLLRACRVDDSSADAELPGDLPWDEIIAQGLRLGLAAQLHSFAGSKPRIPPAARQRLQELNLRQAGNGVAVYEQLREILQALNRAGVNAIVLKGAALAAGIYQNIATRPMKDLDVLIRKDKLPLAEATLASLGYRPHASHRSRAWYAREHHHLAPMTCPGKPLVVELHWSIIPTYSPITVSIDGLWDRARTTTIADVPTLVLSTTDLLLHLCHHFDDLVGRLGTIRDVAEVIRREGHQVDWPRFAEDARRSGASARAYAALRLAHSIIGTSAPTFVVSAVREGAGYSPVDDHLLDWIAYRTLTRTEVAGIENIWLVDWGQALLCGRSTPGRFRKAAISVWKRTLASLRNGGPWKSAEVTGTVPEA